MQSRAMKFVTFSCRDCAWHVIAVRCSFIVGCDRSVGQTKTGITSKPRCTVSSVLSNNLNLKAFGD